MLGLSKPLDAAALYMEAARYQPEDSDARAFLARAYELYDEKSEAFRLAADLIEQHSCKRAAAPYVRCAPVDESTDALLNKVSPWLSDREVAVAVTVRAHNAADYETAARMAQRLRTEHADFPDGALLAAQTLLASEMAKLHVGSKAAAEPPDVSRLSHVETLASEAHEKAVRQRVDSAAATALFVRSQARKFLGRESEAARDLEEASRLEPRNPDILLARAMRMRDRSERIALLRDAIEYGGGERITMVLAMVLATEEDDQLEAAGLFRSVAQIRCPLQEDAAGLAFEAFVNLGLHSEAGEMIQISSDLDDCLAETLKGELARSQGDLETARQRMQSALLLLEREQRVAAVRRRLATLLTELDSHEHALPIWLSLSARGIDSPDERQVINSALAQQKHDVVLERCASLREREGWTAELIDLEASILDQYDPEQSYQLLKKWLIRDPDDRLATLRFSFAALRTGRRDEAVTDLGRLPSADGKLEIGIYVVQLLLLAELRTGARDFAYALLRAHWDEPEAHLRFFGTLMEVETESRDFPEVVGPGTAVRYREVGEVGQDRWVVLEDSSPVYPKLDEIAADSARARVFLGARAGDRVSLATGVEPREGELLEVVDKYAFRWRQCGADYQLRFPGSRGLQTFKIDDDDESLERRFATMFKLADRRAEWISDLLTNYREKPLPLFVLSEALGTDPISTQISIANDPRIAVRSATNDLDQHQLGVADAAGAEQVVLSASSIGTILALGLVDEVQEWGWNLAVTPGMRDLLNHFVRENSARRERRTFGRVGGRYRLEEVSPDGWAQTAKGAQSVLDSCTAVAATDLMRLESDVREKFIKLHGQPGAESIAAATGGDRVLWTDDATEHFVARSHGCAAVGLQALLLAAESRSALSAESVNEITARALALRYETTWYNTAVTKTACRLAEYRPERQPLRSIVDLLEQDGHPPGHCLRTAMLVIHEACSNLALPESRAAATTLVIESLSRRTNGKLLIERIARNVVPAFGLNAVRGYEAQNTIRAWLVAHL